MRERSKQTFKRNFIPGLSFKGVIEAPKHHAKAVIDGVNAQPYFFIST
jgi:hypothetical protein